MKCPKCQAECRGFQIEPNLTVDACRNCRGFWFDKGELGNICKTDIDLPFNENLSNGKQTTRSCTKCFNGQLVEIEYLPGTELQLDVCQGCFGIWLDLNELGQVKQLAKTSTAKTTVTNQFQPPKWYYADNNNPVGPISLAEIMPVIASKGLETLVFKEGLKDWAAASTFAEFKLESPKIDGKHGIGNQTSDTPQYFKADGIIDYKIHGEGIQFVEMELDPGEIVISEPGALMYMSAGIQMDTLFGDPAKENEGIMGKMFSAGKRMLAGESIFISTYHNSGVIKETVAFAAPYPGQIIPFELEKYGSEIICQSRAFLCAARGVQIEIAFQKRIMTGLFGGEGFIMQRLTGTGVAMLHAGGTIVQKTLGPNEKIRVDTGCLVALTPSVKYEVELVKGIKNVFFGGEGLFLATLKGPGDIWLQSMPITKLVQQLNRISNTKGSVDNGSSTLVSTIGNLMNG